MNKTAIKNFAVWARTKLISEITYKASLVGISEKGILEPLATSTDNVQFFDIGTGKPTEIATEEVKQRAALVSRIEDKEKTSDFKTAFQFVMEEVAYTWFNRLVAIRFMEVNEYLPSKIRVLSSEMQGKAEPDMVTNPFDTDMEFSAYETDRIMQLKDENKLDELFRMLFIRQCNKLNEVLPELFEKTSDYTEYLLNISFTDKDGIVSHLVTDIEEKDFTEAVEIIGWLYQYYNTELNEVVYDGTLSKAKISKDYLPAATTIFTPDWAIKYMVDNSLGKLWLEGHNDSTLQTKFRYYLSEIDQEESVKEEIAKIRADYKNIKLEEIKLIDPCMGSGHILVYAFDVFMDIYESQGYTERDAAQSIVEHNIYGLDISDRAYQLAYFAVMMKARSHDRRFFTREIAPNMHSVRESNNISELHFGSFGKSMSEFNRNKAKEKIKYLLHTFVDAKEYGSILKIDACDYDLLNKYISDFSLEGQISLEHIGAEKTQEEIMKIIQIAETMSQKYDVVITNPPYLGNSRFSPKLDKYVKDNYSDVKSDLSMVMFKHALDSMCKENGYVSFITTSSWMFLSSFEKLRNHLFNSYSFDSIADFGTELFDGKVGHNPIVAWVNRKIKANLKFKGIRLVDYCYARRDEKEPQFFNVENHYVAQQENFKKIPGSPIAYWVSEKMLRAFENGILLGDYGKASEGIKTGNNDYFLRMWYEVNSMRFTFAKEDFSKKWYPHHKGGEYRKWYGNLEYIVNWENNGLEIVNSKNSGLQGRNMYFKDVICWSKITSKGTTLRYIPHNCLFDSGSPAFKSDNNLIYVLGFINTIGTVMLNTINPTLNCQVGDIKALPIIFSDQHKPRIDELVEQNICLSKTDWDSFETSWDFVGHPLLNYGVSIYSGLGDGANPPTSEIGVEKSEISFKIHEKNTPKAYTLKTAFEMWETACSDRFNTLKANEEELNRIFIDIYGLQDELTPEVADKDVTVRKADLTRDIKSLISYAVGCMFGRYSLDVDGLAYAGGDWDDSKYKTFIPDTDNVIPITDEEYFEDDIVGLFVAFVKKVYGAETLEENLDFIAKALGNKGDTSREVIRNYFVKDFYKDHAKTYQKRPIYWLYDSGKADGFKALIYMHRYNEDTTGKVRVDYLHKMQRTYMSEIERMQDMIDNSTNPREVAQSEKRKEKLIKQLKETKDYDEKIAHLALSRIAIDLDDGVKVNYNKVQTAQDGKMLNVLGKI